MDKVDLPEQAQECLTLSDKLRFDIEDIIKKHMEMACKEDKGNICYPVHALIQTLSGYVYKMYLVDPDLVPPTIKFFEKSVEILKRELERADKDKETTK